MLPAILGGLSLIGGLLGKGASSSANGRRTDAEIQNALNAQNNAANLNAAQFNLTAPSTRASQVARGGLMADAQNAPLTGDPRIDKFAGGGLRPSVFNAQTRSGGQELQRQALMALMSKSDQLHPQMSTLPKSGLMEKIGGIAGLVGGLAGGLKQMGVGGPQAYEPNDQNGWG